MTIICDIDCIVNDLMDKLLYLYNSRSGKNIQMSDITAYDFYDCLPYDEANELEALFKD